MSIKKVPLVITDLAVIKILAAERENENDAFRRFLKMQDSAAVDAMVHPINNEITEKIDCTQCGNCCKSLLINVTAAEAGSLAQQLQLTVPVLKEKYMEESQEGEMVINSIPCHFLSGTRCSIYENRFADCRNFPHLHKDNFTGRLFGTLMHYAICPIVFNVVEELKTKLDFKV